LTNFNFIGIIASMTTEAKPALVVQNSYEGPGLIGATLDERQIPRDYIHLDLGDKLPDFEKYGLIVVLGGSQSAYDQTDEMREEVRWVKEIIRAGTPYVGICLGMQILGQAAGARVVPATEIGQQKELGFFDADGHPYMNHLTREGRADQLFNGLERRRFGIFQLHGDTVTDLPLNIKLLATADTCTTQIIKVGEAAYGIQGHLEVDLLSLKEIFYNDKDLRNLSDNEAVAQISHYISQEPDFSKRGYQTFNNFIDLAGYQKLSTAA
jgi:GMP synthase-like glutamine amidotransferase